MKKLILSLLLTFCVIILFAQYTPMTAAGYQFKRILCDSTLHIPSFCGIPTLRNSTAKNGAIAMDTCNGKFYMWTNQIGWGQITGVGTDTTSLSNRIDQRVKYTDTAAMLLAYLKKQDTANKWVANVTKVNDSTIRVFKGGTITDLKILGKPTDTTSLSNRIDQKLGKADSSIYYTKYRSDTSRTNIYNLINTKLAKTDTTNKWVNAVTKVNDSTIRVWKGTTSTTIELPRGSGGGSGSVTSVGTGYGLNGGPITSTGTIIVDSATLSTKYLRRADTSNLVATKSNVASKLNISDTTNKWVNAVTKINDTAIRVWKGTTSSVISLAKDMVYTQSPIMSKVSNDSNIIYFNADTANAWRGSGGGGTTPGLQEVLTQGKTYTDGSFITTLADQYSTDNMYIFNTYYDGKDWIKGKLSISNYGLDPYFTFGICPDPTASISGENYVELRPSSLNFTKTGNIPYIITNPDNTNDTSYLSLPYNPLASYSKYDTIARLRDIRNMTGGGSVSGSGTANYLPIWSTTTSLGNSTINDSASTLWFKRGGTNRSWINNQGFQYWKLNDGSSEVGQIGYGTPGGVPGIVFTNNAGTGRSDFRHQANGGFTIATTTSSSVPSSQFFFHPTGDFAINQAADSNYNFLVNGDSKFTDSVKMTGLGQMVDTTQSKPLTIDANGQIKKSTYWPTVSTSGFVPYTGATQDVDLGTNKISSASVYLTGTNGNGHLHMKHQASDATASGQSTALYADANGDIKWKNAGNYYTTLKTSGNTANAIYTYPSSTTTLIGAADTATMLSKYARIDTSTYYLIADATTSNTTATNTNLTFNLGANEVRRIMINGTCSKATSSTGLKLAIGAPTGATIKATLNASSNAISSPSVSIISAINTLGTTINTATATEMPFRIEGIITNGSTAGAVTLQFATVTSNVATIYAGTLMSVSKVKGL